MKIKKQQLKWFLYWMHERHNIFLRRKAGEPFPWTKDKILREYKFTNVYRQLDKVTQAWTQRFITILFRGKDMSDGDLLFHCAMFRLFNHPETYDTLYYNMPKWNKDKAIKLLTERANAGHQIFTGAYIIPNAGRKDPKIQVICEALDYLYDGRSEKEKKKKHPKPPRRDVIARKIVRRKSLRKTVKLLEDVPTIGGFIAYEIACDLRHTRLLADARDILSWANPGPGAMRGIHRLLTGGYAKVRPKPDYVAIMRELYNIVTLDVKNKPLFNCEWPFEMREIEHSLCEFDKYMRVKNGEGRPRSKYKPPDLPWE